MHILGGNSLEFEYAIDDGKYVLFQNNYNKMEKQSYPCAECMFRASYDRNPKSVFGRFWRWHINFCPGWKSYFTHQDEDTKAALREKYNFNKYQ